MNTNQPLAGSALEGLQARARRILAEWDALPRLGATSVSDSCLAVLRDLAALQASAPPVRSLAAADQISNDPASAPGPAPQPFVPTPVPPKEIAPLSPARFTANIFDWRLRKRIAAMTVEEPRAAEKANENAILPPSDNRLALSSLIQEMRDWLEKQRAKELAADGRILATHTEKAVAIGRASLVLEVLQRLAAFTGAQEGHDR